MLLKIIFNLSVISASFIPNRMNNPMFAATSEHEANEFMPPMAFKRGIQSTVDRYLNDFDFVKKSFPLSVPLDNDSMEFQLGN